ARALRALLHPLDPVDALGLVREKMLQTETTTTSSRSWTADPGDRPRKRAARESAARESAARESAARAHLSPARVEARVALLLPSWPMARVLRLPDHGRLIVCTDLQGCLRDYRRVVEIFEQAHAELGDAHLLFTGDLVHGPHI